MEASLALSVAVFLSGLFVQLFVQMAEQQYQEEQKAEAARIVWELAHQSEGHGVRRNKEILVEKRTQNRMIKYTCYLGGELLWQLEAKDSQPLL